MSKRYPRAKWVLPNVVDPTTSVCYTVPVPNEKFHIAAFLGALQDLGSATQWADDEAHTAKEVAQVWRDIIDELERELCSGCKHTNGLFRQPLEAGEVATMSVTVEAGEFQILPIVLLRNQSITISSMVGQWRDSTYHPEMDCSSNWETPLAVVINAPEGATADTFITDIMPDVPHMKLIMRVNNCGILTYHDLDDPITYTVPNSVDENGVFVEFLANMPLDEDGEVAPGFLGYGMVCFKAIVSDPNLCPQVFIDFETVSGYVITQGEIVSSSPIGEGKALQKEDISAIFALAAIDVEFTGCAVRDYAFTIWAEATPSSGDLQCTWVARDEDGNDIQTGDETFELVDETTQSFTVECGSVPGVFELRLAWGIVNSVSGQQSNFYIDSVFVN